MQGSHAHALDSFRTTALSENFSIDKVRAVASTKLPFIEVIINNSKVASMGLTPDKIHDLEAGQAASHAREWMSSAQLDISAFTQGWAAFQASTSTYDDAQKLHDGRRDTNAASAVSKWLFGRDVSSEDGSSNQVGFMTLSHMPLVDYATKFNSALRAHRSAVLSTPCVCRVSAVDADVATVLVCDFAQMGSLKSEALQAAKAVMANAEAACMIVCHPEVASGYSTCVLAPREKAAAASAGDAEDDPSTVVDAEAVLPIAGDPAAPASKKTAAQLRKQLANDRLAVHRELGLGIDNFYPEDFANKFAETDPRVMRHTKSGFVRAP